VTVGTSAVKGALRGGGVTARSTQSITLDASGSTDPDDPEAGLEYRWECARADDTGGACLVSSGDGGGGGSGGGGGTTTTTAVFSAGGAFSAAASKATSPSNDA